MLHTTTKMLAAAAARTSCVRGLSTVGVLGAGQMGGGIAQVAAVAAQKPVRHLAKYSVMQRRRWCLWIPTPIS